MSDADNNRRANKDYPNIEKVVDTMRIKLENKYMALCKELEKEGYSWIDAGSEDSALIDHIEANEYEFTKEGNRF